MQDLVPPPFAPPFLVSGTLVIAQTANILLFLGRHHGGIVYGKPADGPVSHA
jgi:hypothetical protein